MMVNIDFSYARLLLIYATRCRHAAAKVICFDAPLFVYYAADVMAIEA